MTQNFTGSDPATPPAVTPPATPAPSTPTISAEEWAIVQKRLTDKDQFIETLKQERAQDREALDNMRRQVETLLAAKDVLTQPPSAPAPAAPSISPEDLRKQGFLTVEDLRRAEAEKVAKQNFATVLEIGKKKYGEKLDSVIDAKCAELGVDVKWAINQAQSNPSVFLELFGLKGDTNQPSAPAEASVRSPLNPAPAPEPAKSVMFGATSKDVVNAWRRAAPSAN